MKKQREAWVDDTKLLACILVATGHFFMSMTESGICPDTVLKDWFIRTIYYFHVPLFFICSGYLFQKRSSVTTLSSWKSSIVRKAFLLGVPYFTFSFATWLLKNLFSDSVNTQAESLVDTLFLRPLSPYWYLYTLFFIFLITPTFANRKSAVYALVIAAVLKYIRWESFYITNIYAITQTFNHLIWFVFGMCMCVYDVPAYCKTKEWRKTGMICGCVFLAVSCIDFGGFSEHSVTFSLVMGVLGCVSTFVWMINSTERTSYRIAALSKYTMPIYLMHTIFAAGIRTVLLKFNINNAAIHIVVGLLASFLGPIAAAWVMEKLKLDFLIYPGKYRRQKES